MKNVLCVSLCTQIRYPGKGLESLRISAVIDDVNLDTFAVVLADIWRCLNFRI